MARKKEPAKNSNAKDTATKKSSKAKDTSDANKQRDLELHAKGPILQYGVSLGFIVQLLKKTIEEEAALEVEHRRAMEMQKMRRDYENDLALMSLAFSLLKQDLGGSIDFSKINIALVLAYGRAALADGLPNTDLAHEVLKLAKELHNAKLEHKGLEPVLNELQEKRAQLMPHLLKAFKSNQPSLQAAANNNTNRPLQHIDVFLNELERTKRTIRTGKLEETRTTGIEATQSNMSRDPALNLQGPKSGKPPSPFQRPTLKPN